ncbi:metallophosphoesterase family protein [Metabacillus malikii]|uniref:DNA repair exonuclease SbcCD nuclease subunit n=1 Tax=Metabacillus malikii TaxID=1504265 RepID=A0ABT9ZJ68_9BACI|nr:DNA repair exonuclease [Metabacillus malikii]MDQ0232319.1 DNA repair exonuclease SbcCD nuclease subunit [Metabacillus malikii]
MREPIQFIHAADLHLDSPFIGLKHLPARIVEILRESTFEAFSRLVTFAINRRVNFILLSGDLYDEADRSLKAQLKLKKEFERLKIANIDVYVIHGNHDHMGGQWLELEWPSNVHVFSSSKVEMKTYKKGEIPAANIYGYSYPTRVVQENISTYFEKSPHSSVYHIGMLHGSIEGDVEHDVYCPFKLKDLIAKDFDYWALGHIHKRQILHEDPLILYPGNIQGRNRKEVGEKGFYLVELTETSSQATFHSVEEVIWEKATLSINEETTLTMLIHQFEEYIEKIRMRNKSTLLSFEVIGAGDLSASLSSQQTIEDLIDTLNDAESDQVPFIWVVKIQNHTTLQQKENHELSSFFADLSKTAADFDTYNKSLEPLEQHPLYRKYINQFTVEERKQLLIKAERLLHQELLQHSGVK